MPRVSPKLITDIRDDLRQRMASHIDSRCATDDEVRLVACICEIDWLVSVISEVHSWAVCAAVASPEDMAQNFPRIVQITSPDYEG